VTHVAVLAVAVVLPKARATKVANAIRAATNALAKAVKQVLAVQVEVAAKVAYAVKLQH